MCLTIGAAFQEYRGGQAVVGTIGLEWAIPYRQLHSWGSQPNRLKCYSALHMRSSLKSIDLSDWMTAIGIPSNQGG